MGSVLDRDAPGTLFSEARSTADRAGRGVLSFLKETLTDPTSLLLIGGGPLGKINALLSGLGSSSETQAMYLGTHHIPKAYESLLMRMKKGVPEEELWEQTGKATGIPSGILPWERYSVPYSEISDAPASVLLNQISRSGEFKGPLGTILDHKQLYDLRPDMQKVRTSVEVNPKLSGFSGWFSPKFNRIHVSGPDESGLKSMLLHEGNHAVGERTYLPSGSSPEDVKQLLINNEAPKDLQWLTKRLFPGKDIADLGEEEFLKLYKLAGGEKLSRATEVRENMPLYQRIIAPMEFDDKVWIPEDSKLVTKP